MTTEELLEIYDKITKERNKERGLWNLLKSQENKIKGLIEEDSSGLLFHKAFRQMDVTENSYIDMAIWNLLFDSTLFWEVLEKFEKTNSEG